MEKEPIGHIERAQETQETLRDIDVRAELTNSLQADNRILSNHPEYQALSKPEDAEQRTALVDRIVKSSEEYLDEPLAREGVEKAVRHMQLNVLINEAVASLLTENPITVESFKDKMSAITRRSETQDRINEVYNNLLEKYEEDRRLLKTRGNQPVDVVEILDQFSEADPRLQVAANHIRVLREDLAAGRVKPVSQALPTPDDCIVTAHLPFTDVIIEWNINQRFERTEQAESSESSLESGMFRVEGLQGSPMRSEAEKYMTKVQGRHLVVVHDDGYWLRDRRKAIGFLRHEIEHVINAEINPTVQEATGRDYDNRSLQECIGLEEARLIDELGAFGTDSYFTGIIQDVYLPRSLVRLERRAGEDEEAKASINEFERKWKEVLGLLQDIEDLVRSDKGMSLLVYNATARVSNVEQLLENLDVVIALLTDQNSE
ncbi:hypothetical protein KKC87_04010 [Patescibacteria group bacterium]|nr:hypothetical protein [Patescibacteria group bacterium]